MDNSGFPSESQTPRRVTFSRNEEVVKQDNVLFDITDPQPRPSDVSYVTVSLSDNEGPSPHNDGGTRVINTKNAVPGGHHVDTTVEKSAQLSSVYESFLSRVGFGKFHLVLLVVVGLCLFYCGLWMVVVGYYVPDIVRDLCLTENDTGWLRGSIFVGPLTSAIVWGCASDLSGRKPILVTSLVVAGIFGLLSSVVESYGAMVFSLVLCGIGLGGVIPVSIVYYYEFLPKSFRLRHSVVPVIFIVLGSLFVPLITTGLASYEVTIHYYDNKPFEAWRISLILFSLMCVCLAGVVFFVLPESPRILIQGGMWMECVDILAKIHKWHKGKTGNDLFRQEMNESDLRRLAPSLPSVDSKANETYIQKCVNWMKKIISKLGKVLTQPLSQYTNPLVICVFCFSFGFIGWTLWFPVAINSLQTDVYQENQQISKYNNLSDDAYPNDISIHRFEYVTFNNVTFNNLLISDTEFYRCTFEDCTFYNILSTTTIFNRSTLINTLFERTDFQDHNFIDTENRVFLDTRGCSSVVSFAPTEAYWKMFAGALCGVVSVGIGIGVLELLGPKFLLVIVSGLTSIVVCFAWTANSVGAGATLNAFFQLFATPGWCVLVALTTAYFPTSNRGSAAGLMVTVATAGGLIGIGIMGSLSFDVSEALRIILTVLLLIVTIVVTFMKIVDPREIMTSTF
ncbi:synaptic vesicle glycoprotein 2B-like [Antedon mediterranea]|uniref:synaptic vesicle glycoprotein 2B-like n=1 Tax=Antedon mediterranea TaxID=105859 RepID=UPI003AF9F743